MDLLRSGAGSSITWLNSRFGWGADVIYSFFLLNKVKRKLRIRGGIYLRTREDSGLCTGKKKKAFLLWNQPPGKQYFRALSLTSALPITSDGHGVCLGTGGGSSGHVPTFH